MEEVLKSSFGTVATFFGGLIYSYYVVSKLPKGLLRILAVIPVVGMYILLPLQLSSMHMRGTLSFIFTWIGTFKLIMLCFDLGPLANPWANFNLFHFVGVAAFPVEINEYKPKAEPNNSSWCILRVDLIIKGCLLALLIYSYSFRHLIPQSLILMLYGVHMYLALDIVLGSQAMLLNSLIGAQLKPQSNKPYLASSLKDFWGARWNLIVTNILRPSVYGPVLSFCWMINIKLYERSQGNQATEAKPPLWARGFAVISSFLVSGLMHELIFYYLTEKQPSWEVTAFFTLHGLAVAIEICLTRNLSPYITLPKFISIPTTLLIVYSTGIWLFFPPITRHGIDIKTISEYHALFQYLFPTKR
ncbi:hypothetical protein SUGI_1194090 [Cryptomeria japonica]|uniref:long-chain-alcohol O-fatty-acyltransferase n=1 Tax=Cryptomeria japonica TaxID=3369 RepID=UPI002414A203|nr:long-chain-alcohol O-fatty-acyltransferase [Cryptomeria japonica]GLJ55597.1 hypothetical protein SUGI_1194090 [Cryptomeria japonica]